MGRSIQIMDTTLRDGEQTRGVSFTANEKLTIAKLLLNEVNVDRIEVASARVSSGELEAVQKITKWAKEENILDKIEVLTFVDGRQSITWMEAAGAKVMNLLTKGSFNHLKHQLKKSPAEHQSNIKEVLDYAKDSDITVNVYLEDWSNGMRNSKSYAKEMLSFFCTSPVEKILLPDTLGILTPSETFDFISEIIEEFPDCHFDFHAHNDYDLGTANVYEAVRAGIHGLHLTVNGMGERAGNAPMASAIAVLNDYADDIELNVNEQSLYSVSKLVENISGLRIPANKPIVGSNVFTQTAGVHADGDKKNKLYFSDLMPERFGRTREYALGKTSGKANIENNLNELGISLSDEDLKKVTRHIIELGDKKETVTKDDLPYIISDVLNQGSIAEHVKVIKYVLTHASDLQPSATIKVKIGEEIIERSAQGDGQYDAFMNALKKIYKQKNLVLPTLLDYSVRIPPGGKTDALCETFITWNHGPKGLKTRGLDSDQTVSAIKATQRMLNIVTTI